jgi:hypothetical protein
VARFPNDFFIASMIAVGCEITSLAKSARSSPLIVSTISEMPSTVCHATEERLNVV